MFKNSRLTIMETAVRFVKPDIAIARSAWQFSGHVGPAGEPLPERKGISMNLIVRNGGEWVIVHSQNTGILEGVLAPPPRDPVQERP